MHILHFQKSLTTKVSLFYIKINYFPEIFLTNFLISKYNI